MSKQYKNNKTVALSTETKQKLDELINNEEFNTADEAIAFLFDQQKKLMKMRSDMYLLDKFTGGEIYHLINNFKSVEYEHNHHQYIQSILMRFNELFELLYNSEINLKNLQDNVEQESPISYYTREKLPKAIWKTLDVLIDEIKQVKYDPEIAQESKEEYIEERDFDKIEAFGDFVKAWLEIENIPKEFYKKSFEFAGVDKNDLNK